MQVGGNYSADVADSLEFGGETEPGERQSFEKSHLRSRNDQVSNQAVLAGTHQSVGKSVSFEDGTSLPTNHQQGHHRRAAVGSWEMLEAEALHLHHQHRTPH